MDKKGIRNLGKLLRKGNPSEGYGEKAYEALSKIPEYKKASRVMVYLSLKAEAPTDELLEKILKDGKKVCVPSTVGNIITPVEVLVGTEFESGEFGVREPKEKKAINAEGIDIVLVPGLLFDKRGTRCGYGKGCYDLFLKDSCALKVGIAFDRQVVTSFPSDVHDIKMDYIITEKGLVDCEKES